VFNEFNKTYSYTPLPIYLCKEIEQITSYKPFANIDQASVDENLGGALCIDPRELEFSGGQMRGTGF
jgi:hypothetical protein